MPYHAELNDAFRARVHQQWHKVDPIDNLLVRIHFIVVMIRRTGLAPWEAQGRRYPYRANVAHIRQARPDYGLVIRANVLKTF